jgi:nitrite reductase/ring-hydroxylating ferredoxin subunit
MPAFHDICALDEIPDKKARGFTLNSGDKKIDFFIVRKGGEVFGYINSCPHTGINLDWQPDQFLDLTGYKIQCSTHGALFRIRDGYCTYGPCLGRSLTPVQLIQDNGRIKLARET